MPPCTRTVLLHPPCSSEISTAVHNTYQCYKYLPDAFLYVPSKEFCVGTIVYLQLSLDHLRLLVVCNSVRYDDVIKIMIHVKKNNLSFLQPPEVESHDA